MISLTQNFLRRYENNRAPFGIFIHADPWLTNNGAILKEWIEEMLDNPAYPDLHFVTNVELLDWMKNPVTKDHFQPRDCHAEGDVYDCFPPAPEYKCKWGEIWNNENCSCECNAPRCLTSDGRCSDYCPDRELPNTDPHPSQCYPAAFTGCRAFDDCKKYYYCEYGSLTTGAESCPEGMLFDEVTVTCNFPLYVPECNVDECGVAADSPTASPSQDPTTSPIIPTTSPSAAPSDLHSASPSAAPTVVSSASPTAVASSTPTDEPTSYFPPGGCCSHDFATCGATWCGSDKAGCDVCNQWGGYVWLENGAVEPGSCEVVWTECTARYLAGTNPCCPGLECLGSQYYAACKVPPSRMLRG